MTSQELEVIAKSIRRRIFDFKTSSGVGHLASCLSLVDILVSLYYDNTCFDSDKDILVFSKTHGSPAIYPILVDRGLVDKSELDKYCQKGGMLRLHADASIPGCQFVGGSLGNGLGYASGLAFRNPEQKVFVILGDGELYEGTVWESLQFISHHNLNNMKLIVDRNQLSILGATEKLLKLEPLISKFESFGFFVSDLDGHNFEDFRQVFSRMWNRPEVLICNTIKGKGVSYMENVWQYHTIIPKDPEQIRIGRDQLS